MGQNSHSGRVLQACPALDAGVGRDPWFDTLTTLSEVEGESRKTVEYQIILDLPPTSAGDDEL